MANYAESLMQKFIKNVTEEITLVNANSYKLYRVSISTGLSPARNFDVVVRIGCNKRGKSVSLTNSEWGIFCGLSEQITKHLTLETRDGEPCCKKCRLQDLALSNNEVKNIILIGEHTTLTLETDKKGTPVCILRFNNEGGKVALDQKTYNKLLQVRYLIDIRVQLLDSAMFRQFYDLIINKCIKEEEEKCVGKKQQGESLIEKLRRIIRIKPRELSKIFNEKISLENIATVMEVVQYCSSQVKQDITTALLLRDICVLDEDSV